MEKYCQLEFLNITLNRNKYIKSNKKKQTWVLLHHDVFVLSTQSTVMVDENTVGLWVTNDKIPAGHQTQYLVIPWPFHKPRYLPTCLSEPIINFWYCLFSVLWYFCSLLLKALSECWSSAVCVCVCAFMHGSPVAIQSKPIYLFAP